MEAAGYDPSGPALRRVPDLHLAQPAGARAGGAAPAGPVATTFLSYSGSGDVTASVSRPADAGSGNEGCDASDFAGFAAGNIALVQRGTCTFAIKSTNAYNAGASAVIIWNNQAGVINGTLGFTTSPSTFPSWR
jgi:hypothetical protein